MGRYLRNEKYFPVSIFFIALVIRLIPVFLTMNLGIGLDDMFQYDMLARSIESGNGYRWYAQEDLDLVQKYFKFDVSNVDYDPRGILTSFRPPLYPTFLALIYSIFGVGAKRFFVTRIVQSILGALLAPITYWVSQSVLQQKSIWNKFSAWVVSLYPMLVIYPLSLATENLFFLFMMISIWVLLIAEKRRRLIFFVLAGFILGLTCLTRSVAMGFAFLSLGWVWFILKERKFAIYMGLAVMITTVPWMIRNTILHQKLTGIESALGYDLYVGYHPESTGTFQYGISLDLFPYLDDGLRDEIGQNRAIEFIKSEPNRIPYLIIRKLGYFWGLERRALTFFYSNNFFGFIPGIPLLISFIFFLSPFVIVSLSSIMGLVLIKWDRSNVILGILLVGYLIPHILILAEDRFHLALVPLLAIFASIFWEGGRTNIIEKWKNRNGKYAIMCALLVLSLLIANWSLELYRDREMLVMLFGPNGNITYLPY